MTITVTPTVEASNSPPRVRLDIAASAGETSSTIQRINPDGSLVPVRTQDGNPQPISAGTALLYDYECPLGQGVRFTSVQSPGTVSAQVTVPGTAIWLVHPGIPGLSMMLKPAPGCFAKRVRSAPRGVFAVMGRKNVIVFTDGARKGMQSQLVVYVRSSDEKTALEALTADCSTLLLNVPASLGYNVATRYISLGDSEEDPVTNLLTEAWMTVTFPFDEVDRPDGGTTSQRTYADVLSGFATYSSFDSSYASYAAALAGP